MRFSKFLIPISLVIAVILSLALSVILWTNPANYRSKTSTTQNPQDEVLVKPKRSVFSPTQAVVNDKDGSQNILVNRSVNMISEIKHQMRNYQNAKLKTTVSQNQKKYFEMATRPNSILLNYASPVMISTVNAIVHNKFANLDDHQVTRILLPLDDSSRIFLLNDSNFTVYQVSVKKHSLKGLNNVLKIQSRRFPVSIRNLNGTPLMYVDQPVQMQPYKYLLDRQSADYFVSRLLNDENSANVTVKRRQNTAVYSDQRTKQLVFNSKSRIATYSNYSANNIPNNLKSVIDDSYRLLLKIGLPMDNLRFYGFEKSNNREASFRTFVEGFPIFRQNGFGEIAINTVNESVQKINFLLDTPQVPIPSKDGYTTLPPTETVLKRLKAHGYNLKRVKKVRLGYDWKQKQQRSMLINLTPDWFIQYNNKWYSYSTMLSK